VTDCCFFVPLCLFLPKIIMFCLCSPFDLLLFFYLVFSLTGLARTIAVVRFVAPFLFHRHAWIEFGLNKSLRIWEDPGPGNGFQTARRACWGTRRDVVLQPEQNAPSDETKSH